MSLFKTVVGGVCGFVVGGPGIQTGRDPQLFAAPIYAAASA